MVMMMMTMMMTMMTTIDDDECACACVRESARALSSHKKIPPVVHVGQAPTSACAVQEQSLTAAVI